MDYNKDKSMLHVSFAEIFLSFHSCNTWVVLVFTPAWVKNVCKSLNVITRGIKKEKYKRPVV